MKEYIKLINGWLLVATAAAILVVHQLISSGMFFDGLTYASVSENMGNSFWSLHYTETFRNDFYEHPPLAFWLQSIFMSCGIEENLYSLCMLMLAGWLMARIFRITGGDKELAWFPTLLFVCTPIVFWSFGNNMLENTLTVFVLLTTYIQMVILNKNLPTIWSIIPGLLLVACFLVKGPVGLFPLVILPLHWYFLNEKLDYKKYINHFLFCGLGIIIFSIFLFLNDNSRIFLSNYFNQQVLASIAGEREVSSFRFSILIKLFLEILIMAGFTLILYFIQKKSIKKNQFLFFVSIGLCASLPILISAKQLGFYIVPSLAFFALGFSFLVNKKWMEYLSSWVIFILLVATFFVSSFFVIKSSIGATRDKPQFELVNFFGEKYYHFKTISVSKRIMEDWVLHAYLYRYCTISLDDKNKHEYLILSSDERIPGDYQLEFKTQVYNICTKNKIRKEKIIFFPQ